MSESLRTGPPARSNPSSHNEWRGCRFEDLPAPHQAPPALKGDGTAQRRVLLLPWLSHLHPPHICHVEPIRTGLSWKLSL